MKILITGAFGQLGTALTEALINTYGSKSVIATDLHVRDTFSCETLKLDVTNLEALDEVVRTHQITQIYHLAAVLSAKGELEPLKTWDLNNSTFFNVLEVARLNEVRKVFFPSSIAVFGADARNQITSNDFPLNPTTVYGISKVAGEHWASYYNAKYNMDVRCLRYPGLISYQSLPGGGTTDYAVDIFHKAVNGEDFECYLSKDTQLPMLYMDDAIDATIRLMEAPKKAITRVGYNIQGVSFSPEMIAEEIRKNIPKLTVVYNPDNRQKIAESWPIALDDTPARMDWGWEPEFDLKRMTEEMLYRLAQKKRTNAFMHA
ncbi:NAD-dependent epimerase/dehydratase family protein [Leeuwenhoekiella marinoflava]|uniref:NAD-dependent epimerase/dehydratase family protein n=1 Tax=Leeuwenhoekiella marinoflava TaxID=988 RepID=UPI003002DB7C